jgi:hypothetical protein
MNGFKKYFYDAITKRYPRESSVLIVRMNEHYSQISKDTSFALSSKNPIDRRLDFSACFLALIKTLNEKSESYEHIRETCLEVVTEYVKPKNAAHSFVKRLIPKLTSTWLGQVAIRSLAKKVGRNENPGGFVAHIITEKDETYGLGYGVDILECGICKLFTKHSYGKYVSILCEVDQITSRLAGLTLIRSGTIANGAKKCDFRFKRN